MSARAALKAATRSAHDALDRLFSRLDLSERDEYASFLTAHAAAFLPVEDALTKGGIERILPRWPDMRRGRQLRADIDALGLKMPPPVTPPALESDAAMLGAAYVLEGSRLGGKLIGPGVGAGFPASFLTHKGPMRWAEFVAVLDRELLLPDDLQLASTAAIATFGSFSDAARPCVSREE